MSDDMVIVRTARPCNRYHTDPECRFVQQGNTRERPLSVLPEDSKQCKVCGEGIERNSNPDHSAYNKLANADPDEVVL